MSTQIVHLHHQAPAKPAVGQPCTGCGVCCALETCPAGRLRFRRAGGPCPALEWSAGDRLHRCGLLLRPAHYLAWLPAVAATFASRCFRRWIAAGRGCDCSAEVQPPAA